MKTLFNLCASFLIIISLNSFNLANKSFNYNKYSAFPVNPDTSLAYGDTVSIGVDGEDTIYYLNDVISEEEEDARLIGNHDIFINLTNTTYELNERIFGVSLEGFFQQYTNTIAEQELYSDAGLKNPYELMVEFAPKSIRFPSGASSKFMHLLGSYNALDENNPKQGLYNGGYGYEIKEIINFYDITDDEIDVPTFSVILSDMLSGDEKLSAANDDWLDGNDVTDFEKFFMKWYEQPTYSRIMVGGEEQYEDEPLYINDFIRLVNMIEDENNYRVDVTMTINILSEPAAKVTEIIDYLQSDRVITDFDVNLVGVEMGNECYFEFYGRALGFECYVYSGNEHSAFDHYWEYINGSNNYNTDPQLEPNEGDFVLEDVLPNAMFGSAGGLGKHDYIGHIRGNADYNSIKIGIPAENPDGDYAYLKGENVDEIILSPCDTIWNTELIARYNDKFDGKYIINAVIPHLYLDAKNKAVFADITNWGKIPVGNYTEDGIFVPQCLDNVIGSPTYENFTDDYDFTSFDPKLQCAFQEIINAEKIGSFNEFIRSKQKEAMIALSSELKLNDEGYHSKDCWITEYNIKNNFPDNGDVNSEESRLFQRRNIYDNSFVHAYLIQEQFLNNNKFNYNASFRNEFLSTTHIHNFMGGSETDLIVNSLMPDLTYLDVVDACGDDDFKPFLPRTLYNSYKLCSTLHLENALYLKSIKSIYASNNNVAPTMFIQPETIGATSRTVYGYFSNVKAEEQTYIINPGTLTTDLEGIHAYIHAVIADQLYSNSGRSGLYNINDFYDDCEDDGYDHWSELHEEPTTIIDNGVCPTNVPKGRMCVTVPAYSVGYFEFSYDPELKLGEIKPVMTIYPNPSPSIVNLQFDELENYNENELMIYVYTPLGQRIIEQKYSEQDNHIDIQYLPNGIYLIALRKGETVLCNGSFVKSE